VLLAFGGVFVVHTRWILTHFSTGGNPLMADGSRTCSGQVIPFSMIRLRWTPSGSASTPSTSRHTSICSGRRWRVSSTSPASRSSPTTWVSSSDCSSYRSVSSSLPCPWVGATGPSGHLTLSAPARNREAILSTLPP